jgi:ABC-type nitrate/sulfonate/bicarbonate transport system permease component
VKNWFLRSALGWAAVAAALLVWQFGAVHIGFRAVASVTASVAALRLYFTHATIVTDILPSLERLAIGFGIAAVGGIVIGALLGYWRPLEAWLRPLIDFLRAIPPPLIIPVAIPFLGLGSKLIEGSIVFGAIWPVLINTTDGVMRVDPGFLEIARVSRMRPWKTLLRVSLPAALPLIFAGLRIALMASLIIMILSEMLAGSSGIGFLILSGQQTLQINLTYAGLLLVAILGWLLDGAMLFLESAFLRGRPVAQRGAGV